MAGDRPARLLPWVGGRFVEVAEFDDLVEPWADRVVARVGVADPGTVATALICLSISIVPMLLIPQAQLSASNAPFADLFGQFQQPHAVRILRLLTGRPGVAGIAVEQKITEPVGRCLFAIEFLEAYGPAGDEEAVSENQEQPVGGTPGSRRKRSPSHPPVA